MNTEEQFCPICTRPIENNARHCPSCGTKVRLASASGNVTVGNIENSSCIAVGTFASVNVVRDSENRLRLMQHEIFGRLDALVGEEFSTITDARIAVRALVQEAHKGEAADETVLAHLVRSFARMGKDILDVVTACLLNPWYGIATVGRKIAKKAREESGLPPVLKNL